VRRSLPARLPAALAVAALAVTLVACSSPAPSDDDGFDADGCATSGSASESVKVTGDFGKAPKVEFSEDLTVENTQRSVKIEGKGDAAAPGSDLAVSLALYDVATSKELIPYSDEPQSLTLDEAALLAGIVDTLNCAQAGERVVGVVPPERAFGADGQTDIGVDPDATLIFVVDVVAIVPPVEPSEWTENVPTVTRDAAGIPTVTLPEGPIPTELQLAVLEEGDGAVVERGDSVTVDYQGISWDTKTIFDQSFGKEPATFSTSGVIKGFEAALVGQKVGSTVIVVIPPELAYGTDPEAHELGGQTLVFLIDIKDTKAP
jgi:FKBP-type peptidyl-prolyl cis-trans isomerase